MLSDVIPVCVYPNGDGWEQFANELNSDLGIICAEIEDWADYLPLDDQLVIAERQLSSFLLHRSVGCLHDIACKRLNMHVEPLLFRDDYGRPRTNVGDINLSHSSGKVVLIAAPHHSVGIDIEPRGRCLPEKSFHAWSRDEERAWIATIDPKQRTASIVWLWTAKEAYAKAIGLGLNLPFRKIIVKPGRPSGHIGLASDAFGDEELDDIVTWSDIIPGFIVSSVRISHDKAYGIRQSVGANRDLGSFCNIGKVRNVRK